MNKEEAGRIVFSFSGRIRSRDLMHADIPQGYKLANELERSAYVSREIRARLERQLQTPVHIDIRFEAGSLEWAGVVDVVYTSINVMAALGGAYGFLQIVKKAIDRGVLKGIERLLGREDMDEYLMPATDVIIIEAPEFRQASETAVRNSPLLSTRFFKVVLLSILASSVSALAISIIALVLTLNTTSDDEQVVKQVPASQYGTETPKSTNKTN